MSKEVEGMGRSRRVQAPGVGPNGGSPASDRRSGRQRGWGGAPGAGAAVERGPETGRGAAGAAG